jgi:hypothetical protein
MTRPAPIILPTPPFDTTGLLAWWDVTKTGFTLTDSFSSPTINYIADLTNSGYDWAQPIKTLQPPKGINGGPFFNGAGVMSLVRQDLFNGLNAFTVYALLRPDLNPGGSARTLLFCAQSASTTFPPGTGGISRCELFLSSGSTGRKPYLASSVRDGVVNTTLTTANQSVGVANGGALSDTVTKVRVGWEVDLRQSPATYASYHNGVLDTIQTWTPAEAFPWALNNNNPGGNGIVLGANSSTVPAGWLFAEFVAGLVLKGVPSTVQRASIDAYFASFP